MNVCLALNSATAQESNLTAEPAFAALTAKSDATQLPARPGAGGGEGGCDAARAAAPRQGRSRHAAGDHRRAQPPAGARLGTASRHTGPGTTAREPREVGLRVHTRM